jgi:IclR family transcriptional regulator, KDG regulon repressor
MPALGINTATAQILNILSSFGSCIEPQGPTELSQKLGLTKNRTYRALRALVGQGYLIKDPSDNRYDLGYRVLEIQGKSSDEFDMRSLCAPHLRRIHELTGESVFLSIIVGRNHLTIDGVEAQGRRVSHPHGLLVPLHASCASRALLPFLHDAEIEEYIRVTPAPFKRFTPSTITTPDELWAEVRKVRAKGYAEGMGDHFVGGINVAFPVLDSTGRPHAAITLNASTERFSQDQLNRLMPDIIAIVSELNAHSRLHPVEYTARFD